jgi:hypothetical protein
MGSRVGCHHLSKQFRWHRNQEQSPDDVEESKRELRGMEHATDTLPTPRCTIDLGSVTTTTDAHTDVDVGKPGLAQQEQRLEHLVTQNGRLHRFNRGTIHPDQTVPSLAVRHSHGVAFAAKHLLGDQSHFHRHHHQHQQQTNAPIHSCPQTPHQHQRNHTYTHSTDTIHAHTR